MSALQSASSIYAVHRHLLLIFISSFAVSRYHQVRAHTAAARPNMSGPKNTLRAFQVGEPLISDLQFLPLSSDPRLAGGSLASSTASAGLRTTRPCPPLPVCRNALESRINMR